MPTCHDAVRLTLTERRMVATDIAVLAFRAADGGELPRWTPGAHIDLNLGDGIVRQYSLCGDPGEYDLWRVAILREPDGRGGSLRAHALQPGTELCARGPRNHFPLVPGSSYLFLAGGIGITPIMPMIRAAAARGAQWRLVYGGRTRESMAFGAELQALGPVAIRAQDEVGMLDLDAELRSTPPETLIYACGPRPMLDAVEMKTADRPSGCIHMERFTPRDLNAPIRQTEFAVELRQTGLVLPVPPDRSILDVVTDAGIDVLSSCTEGTCGTCETAVLAGAPEHRDSLLSPEEQATGETMMICVSRAKSDRLVLDL